MAATSSEAAEIIRKAGFTRDDKRNGVVFIVAMRAVGDTVAEVVEKIEETFGQDGLNYAVCLVADPSVEELSALMSEAASYKYPKSCSDKLVVFCIAPIGNDNGCKYILCGDGRRCYIKDIVSYFATPKDTQQFFFFDGYLVPEQASPDAGSKLITSVDIESLERKGSSSLPAHLPKQGDLLVACSPLASDQSEMWSLKLCDNIKDYTLPVSTLLEKTWDEVNPSANSLEPHYISSMGVAFLPKGQDDVALEQNNKPGQGKAPIGTPPVTPSTRPVPSPLTPLANGSPFMTPPPTPMTPKCIDLEDIYQQAPDKVDLVEAICRDLNDTDVWKEYFGKRIFAKLMVASSKNGGNLPTTTSPQFLINLLYDDDDKPLDADLTWGNVLHALEEPTKIKRNKDKKPIAKIAREYMEGCYGKYYQRSIKQ